jgi:hypothetical protein
MLGKGIRVPFFVFFLILLVKSRKGKGGISSFNKGGGDFDLVSSIEATPAATSDGLN